MTSFENNQADAGGAVYAVYSRLKFSGNIDFRMNHASKGGAIYLDTGSQLELQSPVAVSFHNNTAGTRGGALLVKDSICENNLLKACFYEVQSASSTPTEDIFLEFTGNSANAGSVLYGGALDYCEVWVNGVQQDFTEFLKNVTIISSNNSLPAITSDPYRICLCTDGEIECDKDLTYHEIVIPGRRFDVALAAVGQANTTTSARIETKPYYSDNIDEKVSVESNSFIPSKCTNVTFQATSDSEDIDIDIFPCGCNDFETLRIHVDLVPCPNGFSLNNSKCSCSASLNHNLVVGCDVQTGLISHAGSYWIQPIFTNSTYKGFHWCTHCPNGYCKPRNKTHPILLNFSSNEHDSLQCADNHSGTLCGACSEGYSLTLSSFECKRCEDRFLSLMVLFVVAGVALIALLLALHITVAAGTLNGLILYANIVNVHRDIFFPPGQPGFGLNPLGVFISWLNLDFGIPTCFYDGLDAYQYSWLQYAFPLYLWFLIGAIILSSKHSRRVGRLLGSNPVAVLAKLILMSYTKPLQTAVETFIYADLESSIGSVERVWKLDGNITYFKGKHFYSSTNGCMCHHIPLTALCTFADLWLSPAGLLRQERFPLVQQAHTTTGCSLRSLQQEHSLLDRADADGSNWSCS